MCCKHLLILSQILCLHLIAVTCADGDDHINNHIHFPDSYRTAKILFELKPPPPAIRPQSFTGCNRPLESDTFNDCTTEGRKFPAFSAWCECRHCHLKLYLTCHDDGQWYANAGVDVCDKSSHRRCGQCNVNAVPATVRCVKTKDGHAGEKRTCSCRNNCIGVQLMCDKTKLWKSDFLKVCDANTIVQSYIPDTNMFKQYKDGKYIYTCRKGFKILGSNVLSCVNGQLSSHRPQCQPEVTTVTETTTTTKLTETTTISTTVHHDIEPTSAVEYLLDEASTTSDPLQSESEELQSSKIEEDQDMNSDYFASQNKLPPKNKFPLTIILIIIFILLILILVAIVLFKLSKHYVLVVQFGNKTFATKPGYTDVKGNECTSVVDNNEGIELRVKT